MSSEHLRDLKEVCVKSGKSEMLNKVLNTINELGTINSIEFDYVTKLKKQLLKINIDEY